MAARDAKSHQITEALHGARQIKFSAIEKRWEDLIFAVREKELGAIWNSFLWAIASLLIWNGMPVILGAVALGTYTIIYHTMSAAVAFTALAIFSSLEWVLSVVPALVTELIDARISIRRIQDHLESPERVHSILPGDSVVLENVSVTWPSNEEKKDAFVLRDVSLHFPNERLRYV